METKVIRLHGDLRKYRSDGTAWIEFNNLMEIPNYSEEWLNNHPLDREGPFFLWAKPSLQITAAYYALKLINTGENETLTVEIDDTDNNILIMDCDMRLMNMERTSTAHKDGTVVMTYKAAAPIDIYK